MHWLIIMIMENKLFTNFIASIYRKLNKTIPYFTDKLKSKKRTLLYLTEVLRDISYLPFDLVQ